MFEVRLEGFSMSCGKLYSAILFTSLSCMQINTIQALHSIYILGSLSNAHSCHYFSSRLIVGNHTST